MMLCIIDTFYNYYTHTYIHVYIHVKQMNVIDVHSASACSLHFLAGSLEFTI